MISTVAEEIGFDRLVDRRLVHRRANAEVLLTGLAQTGERRWAAGIQIPRGHSRLCGLDRDLPEVLGVEAVRQIGIALAHTAFEVPYDWAFTLQDAWLAWAAGGPPRIPGEGPLDLWGDITITTVSRRRETFSGLDLTLVLATAHEVVATAGGSLRVIAPHHYRALRRHAPDRSQVPVRHDPSPLLVPSDRGVGQVWLLGYDLDDPFFFDHIPDHLPGMLFVQAIVHLYRRAEPRRRVGRLDLTCRRFAEYLPLVTINHASTPDVDHFSLTQNEVEVAAGMISNSDDD